MPLRFDLGPHEKLFIGKSVLTNGGSRTMFIVEGETPILRARDVLTPERAVNAPERLYRCVQQMYLEEDAQKYEQSYLALVAQAISERPDCREKIGVADQFIETGQYYKALKDLKELVRQEAFSFRETGLEGSRVAARGSRSRD
jgi:flagellar protein FlbT